jgi:hypothetical protein
VPGIKRKLNLTLDTKIAERDARKAA